MLVVIHHPASPGFPHMSARSTEASVDPRTVPVLVFQNRTVAVEGPDLGDRAARAGRPRSSIVAFAS